MVFALPFIVLALEEAAVAAVAITAAAGATAVAADAVERALRQRWEAMQLEGSGTIDAVLRCDKCPGCLPPVGTIAVERVDRVPPSAAHFPCPGDHAHLVERHQNPRSCACFWNKANPDVYCLGPGEVPPYPPKT